MDNLKELTKQEHRRAERTAFMSRMLKKNITPYQYYVYLKNQFLAYTTLEYYASTHNLLNGKLEVINRGPALLQDIMTMELQNKFDSSETMESTKDYVDYIKEISGDPDKLLAHIYVRHMGDLSGGQIIKKLIPGPTNLYEFDGNAEDLKNDIREKLHDGLHEEAKTCFEMVQKFLEELETHFNEIDK